jgi:predicted ATPase
MDAKHLISFELIDKIRTIEPFKIDFKSGLNVIVGDNGSGKSTLLNLLSKNLDGNINVVLSDDTNSNGKNTMYFDTEKQNPRIKSSVHDIPVGTLGFSLMSHFKSHGETILPIITHIEKLKDTIIFIDEPEAGISLKNQYVIFKALKKAVKNNCQIFVITHSYVIIKSVKTVFDMEQKIWVSSSEYINSIFNE